MIQSTLDLATPQATVAQTGAAKRPEIFSIQYLRAIAAFMVLLTHASASLYEGTNLKSPVNLEWGVAGVDIFFIISGFVMIYSIGHRAIGPLEFYLRRFARLFPLYLGATTVAFLIATVAPHMVRTFSPHWIDYLRSVLFIPFHNDTITENQPELGQGWTLNFEVFFYFWFGMFLLFSKSVRTKSLIAVFCFLVVAGYIFHPANVPLALYTNSIILEFLLGIAVCHVIQRFSVKSVLPGILLFVTGLAFFFVLDRLRLYWDPNLGYHATYTYNRIPRVLFYGVPSAVLITGFLLVEKAGGMPRVPFFLMLGDASYSAYILHTFVLATLRRVWPKLFHLGTLQAWLLFMVVSTITVQLLAVLSFRYFEVPAMKKLVDVFRRRRWLAL